MSSLAQECACVFASFVASESLCLRSLQALELCCLAQDLACLVQAFVLTQVEGGDHRRPTAPGQKNLLRVVPRIVMATAAQKQFRADVAEGFVIIAPEQSGRSRAKFAELLEQM